MDADQPSMTLRAYKVGADGRIETFTVITARNEDDAIQQARSLVEGHAIELWDRDRLIARFEPRRP